MFLAKYPEILSSPLGSRVLAATLAVAALAQPASAQLTVTDYGDNDAIVQSIAFTAEGRIGSNSFGGATFETDIGPTTGAPVQTGEFAWTPGNSTNFTLQYTAGVLTATFAVAGSTPSPLVYTLPSTPTFDTLFIRTRARSDSQALVNTLVFNGTSVTEPSNADCLPASNCPAGSLRDIIGISGFTPSSSFTLTGQATLDWNDPVPTQSQLAFQLTAGTAVPEPSAVLGLLALGVLGYTGRSARRRA